MTVDLIDTVKTGPPASLVPNGFRQCQSTTPAAVAAAQSPSQQTILPSVTPLPYWSGTPGPSLACSVAAPSGPRTPSSPGLPDACLHSTVSVPPALHAPRIPPAAARTENGWGFPTAAQITSTAQPVGRNQAPTSDTLRAPTAHTTMRLQADFDRAWLLLLTLQLNLLVNEPRKVLYSVQNRLNL